MGVQDNDALVARDHVGLNSLSFQKCTFPFATEKPWMKEINLYGPRPPRSTPPRFPADEA